MTQGCSGVDRPSQPDNVLQASNKLRNLESDGSNYDILLSQDEKLNSTYSKTDFSLGDGEQLLSEMQDIREELSQFNATMHELMKRSKTVVPLKQRSRR